MKATLISKDKKEAKFKMEFTAEEFEEAVIGEYKRKKDQFEIDGFRKGKAPRSIIEKHYGESVFIEGAINGIFNENYPKAIEELGLDIIDRPAVEFDNFKKGEDFSCNITVAVYPEIEVKDYKGIELDKIKVSVTNKDVDEELEKLRQRNARMVSVERPAKKDDTVLLDYKGFVDDEQFEGGTAEKFTLKLGSGSFIPGFEDQLLGIKSGEERDVKVDFPKDYHAEKLAGKAALFKCKIHEIKEEEKPELDDDFAKDVSEFDTLEEMKKDLKNNIKEQKKKHAEDQMKNKVLEKVYEANDIKVPDVMVDDEISSMMQEFDQQLRSQGMDLQKYFEYLKKDPNEFREEIREDAHRKVKTRMLVAAVADAEGIEAPAEDVDEEIKIMAIQYKQDPDKIREMLGEENIGFLQKDIRMRKAMDFMFESAVFK